MKASATSDPHLFLTLFVSDIHLGRSDPATERANEAALIRCLEAHEHEVERLYLVGDVFDQYIEYRYLVPKGFVRFQALLTRWTDNGIPVTYLKGNHDPWHRTYFEEEMGVRIATGPIIDSVYGLDVYLFHGDGLDRKEKLYKMLKGSLRHPLPVWLYTTMLPGDTGYKLAEWVRLLKRRYGNNDVKPSTVEALRAHAHSVLHNTTADIVVMGHSHYPELLSFPEGYYLNTGPWHKSRTIGSLNKNALKLLRWNGSCTEEIISYPVAARAAAFREVER